MADPTPNWQALQIQIPGSDFLESVRNVLETLLTFLEVLKTVLETVKTFLLDFGNPIKAIVEGLIKLILTLFQALKQTGLYAWFDIPDPLSDPNFNRFHGGYMAFTTRFKASLADSRDANRPQPISGATKSGFVLIVADAQGPVALVKLVKTLLRFFGKEFVSPQYGPPSNFKVLPFAVNPASPQGGDRILSIVNVFVSQPKALILEWALPQTKRPGDPGNADLIGAASLDFFPPRFLIEKSSQNPNVEITDDQLTDSNATGRVTTIVETNFEQRGQPGVPIKRKVRVNDEYGDPFIKFQKYIEIDLSSAPVSFLLGQLGTFRYVDSDVVPGKSYFYRVRAYSGKLAVNPDQTVTFQPVSQDVIDQIPQLRWPAPDGSDPPIMGRATAVVRAQVPLFPSQKFDVIEGLKRIFQTAFSLNFHLPPPQDFTFDAQGLPVSPTLASSVGLSSLQKLAGPLVAFQAIPLVGSAAGGVGAPTAAIQPDPVTGQLPAQPWANILVRANAARLATIVAGAMLNNNSAEAFRGLMQGPLPKGTPNSTTMQDYATLVDQVSRTGSGSTEQPVLGTGSQVTLEKLVYAMTINDINDNAVIQDTAIFYGDAFTDPVFRLNILAAVNFVKTFTLGGAPPDWIQISILRDIIPWSGQMLYDLIAKIQALLDAFQGVIDEITAFINLIERKIDVLEKFIKYLLSILDFIESLSAGFFLLSVPETSGDAGTWGSLIDSATGNAPPSGPGGYSAGIGLAYVGADVTAFAAAFQLIF